MRAANRPYGNSIRRSKRAPARTYAGAIPAGARKHTVSPVCLLIHTDIVRQSSQQIQLSFHPPQDLLARSEELDDSQTPQIAHNRAAQVAQKTRVRNQEVNDEDDKQWCRPSRYGNAADFERWVLAVGLDCFDAEQQEDPDACANHGGVVAKDESFNESVDASRKQAEGSGEEEEGYDGAILGLKAFEQRKKGYRIEEEVEDILMQERVGV